MTSKIHWTDYTPTAARSSLFWKGSYWPLYQYSGWTDDRIHRITTVRKPLEFTSSTSSSSFNSLHTVMTSYLRNCVTSSRCSRYARGWMNYDITEQHKATWSIKSWSSTSSSLWRNLCLQATQILAMTSWVLWRHYGRRGRFGWGGVDEWPNP